MTEDYKGGRDETPAEIEHQFDLIRTMCETLHIPVLGVTNFEADDVLATLSTWGRDAKIPVVVVSGDRDTFQLVEDPFIKVLYNRRGVSDYALYDEAGIFERCGIESARYPLLAALRGDTSDNLPAYQGWEKKRRRNSSRSTAILMTLYANLATLTPKLRENLAAFEDRARRNELVMRLERDVPLDFTLEQLTLGGWDRDEVNGFFDRYEMNSVKTRMNKLMQDGLARRAEFVGRAREKAAPAKKTAGPKHVANADALLAATSHPVVAFTSERVAVVGSSNEVAVVSINEFFDTVKDTAIAGHDVKGLYRIADDRSVALSDPADDTSIMGFLIDATSGHYDLADLAHRFMDEPLDDARPALLAVANDETLVHDAETTTRLLDVLRGEIQRWELNRVYEEIELPLVRGPRTHGGSRRACRCCAAAYDRRRVRHGSEGTRFGNSKSRGSRIQGQLAQQLQVVLFEELKLTAVKKIKSGYSTDAGSLEAIQDEHPVIPAHPFVTAKWRSFARPTVRPLLTRWVPTDEFTRPSTRLSLARDDFRRRIRICTIFRFRSQEGRRLRYAFVPTEGWLLAVSDYKPDRTAHPGPPSQDPGLLAAFAGHEDVHRAIAASVFGIDAKDVTNEQRERAKAVSYGWRTAWRPTASVNVLASRCSCTRNHGELFSRVFPSLRSYLDSFHRGNPQAGLFAY